MKKILRLSFVLILLPFLKADAQSFEVVQDTIYYSTDGYYSILNNIMNHTSSMITLQWHEAGNNFPAALQATTCLCDNMRCNHDSTFFIGGHYESLYPAGSGEMHLMGDITTLTESGPFYLTLQFNNKDIPTDISSATFIMSRITPTGIASQNIALGVSLFPNPAINSASLSITSGKAGKAVVRIDDMSGRSVYTSNETLMTGNNVINIPLNGVPAGAYVLSVLSGNHIVSRKLTVIK